MTSNNTYRSQWGEDQMLDDIFDRIGTTNRILVDIGAWDGEHLSNTYHLRQKGWIGVLAESNQDRRKDIKREPGVHVFGHVHDIDSMLSVYNMPEVIDLLSIDIDGDDYYLWEAMEKHRARVVVIEYNQTVPWHIDMKQKRGGNFGASARAIRLLAEKKGYIQWTRTTTNLIFVHIAEAVTAGVITVGGPLPSYSVADEKQWGDDHEWLQYIVTGYNGKKYIIGKSAHNDNQGGVHEELITDVKYEPI